MLTVRRLSVNAQPPTKKTPTSVCLQLYSAHNVTVPAHDKALVQTDLEIELPVSTYGRIVNKPGLSVDNEMDVYSPIIEAQNSSNVGIVIYNHGSSDFQVVRGDCIAQLIVHQAVIAHIQEQGCS
ncbi:Deoxyuridine 5'-triphosphate nucleotidohydrolase [Tribonema minus]|uniref:dUTP diphosphatase n=1 Tax=Tribonema minus TaxID=303371 RepID=A0A835ZE92_9STRA|nr:Deoxyuridine 5'-triphosphate nucleotidohydrolase [Tribonema minus]